MKTKKVVMPDEFTLTNFVQICYLKPIKHFKWRIMSYFVAPPRGNLVKKFYSWVITILWNNGLWSFEYCHVVMPAYHYLKVELISLLRNICMRSGTVSAKKFFNFGPRRVMMMQLLVMRKATTSSISGTEGRTTPARTATCLTSTATAGATAGNTYVICNLWSITRQ